MIRLFAALALLSSVLASSAAEWVNFNGRDVHPTRVIVKYKAAPPRAALAAEAASPKVKVNRRYSHIPGLAVVELRDKAALKAAAAGKADEAAELRESIRQLEATGLFEYVQPDHVKRASLTPSDQAFTDGRLWGLRNQGQAGGALGADIDVIKAWDITTGDTNVIVGVIDTGINYTHVDLAPQMWVNPGEIPNNNVDDDLDGYIDNVYGINAVADNGNPKDDNGHGSHCAGTIGAAANGNGPHVGVAWNVRLMALKFLQAAGFGFESDEIQCINFTILKKVKITSNSYGGGGFSQAEFDAIAAARTAGQIFIAAAGNDGEDNDIFPHFPSSYDLDNIVSVAALDRRDQLADFSNYGRNSVDIGAPGVEIFSCWYDSNTAYNTIDGTSMATPHVAGAAALLLAADPASDYLRLRDRLLQRSTAIPALAGKTTTGGRLDVFRAISGQVDGLLEISINPPSGSYFLTNSVATVTVRVTDDFNVNDATVVGRFNNANITFVNGTGVDTNANDGTYTALVTMPGIANLYDLTVTATAPGKAGTNAAVRYEVLPKPENDDFASASKFPPEGGQKRADNRLATTEAGEPPHAGLPSVRSLWWSWSTPTATPVVVDTAGTSFDDDASLAVYTGPAVNALTEVASALATANGPNGTRAPFVKFTAQPNITYWMAVAQTATGTNSPGRVVIRVEPNGDIDTTPPTLRVTNYISGIFIRSASNEIILSGVADDPPPNASGIRESDGVQYKVNNDLLFQTAFGSTNWTTKPIQLTNGYNYIYLKAFDRADNESPTMTFTINYSSQVVANDLFGNSSTLTDVAGVVTMSNATFTKEFNEPSHGGNEGGHSAWFAYTPPSDGVLLLSTEGSNFDTLLSLYTVNDPLNDRSFSKLILIKQNDDAEGGAVKYSEINAAVDGGRLYYIAVDGFGGQTGNIKLNYTFSPVDVYNVTTTSGPGGTVTPASGAFPAGSAVTLTAQPDRYQQLQSYTITSGGQTFTTGLNPFTFTVTGDTTVHAEFGPKVFTDDFESGSLSKLPYQISSSATEGQHWIVQGVTTNTTTGGSSQVARVTSQLKDNSVASLALVTNLSAGVGSFEVRVNTETNYDKLEFLFDGHVLKTWSGSVPWQLFTFEIPLKSTPTRLEWRYTKDAAITVANELVAIDNLDLPIAPPLPPGPILVTISATTTGLRIIAEGPANSDFQLQSSPDLVNWSPVSDTERNSGPTGTVIYNQTAPGSTRFYRVARL
ncbi:MAG TPA: S8 family serine peptidase [Verrucomicrobiae bacterium]|nr:S8 family serine peptidase [Verrucomicrobiae bacterium]